MTTLVGVKAQGLHNLSPAAPSIVARETPFDPHRMSRHMRTDDAIYVNGVLTLAAIGLPLLAPIREQPGRDLRDRNGSF